LVFLDEGELFVVFGLEEAFHKMWIHVAIKAMVNGASVSRSYTPTSNNLDLGKLELVIKYSGSTGDHTDFLAKAAVIFHAAFRASEFHLVTNFQRLEDRDTTEISLIYANRTEEDILLRRELEAFARRYPKP
jgi:cytochrome-b5 reductase